MPLNEDAITFLKYAFTETKDLAKHFLTVITAILVFSLTFSEKIVNFAKASSAVRSTLATAWCSFLLAVIACGVAICFVALAGGAAASNAPATRYWARMRWAISWLLVGGLLFVIGLIGLLVAALLSA